MTYYHGVKASKQATSVSTPVTADSSIHFIVGTAPVHTVDGKVNEPILAYSYAEAVKAMGYSDDWQKYDICEEMYTSFQLYKNAPIVMVNVLDPVKHVTEETTKDVVLTSGVAELSFETLINSVIVKGYNGEELTEEYSKGIDYDLIYTNNVLQLERIEGGKITSDTAKINIKYKAVDPSKVTKEDIIGGYDVTTKKAKGFELVDVVFPKYRVIPTILLAPNFSHNSEVAAIMAAKAECINGLFAAKAIIDVDTTCATTYTEAVEWKNNNNITQPTQLVVFPMVTLGGKLYHYSTHLAGSISATDANEDLGKGTPCESASNKSLQIDGMALADKTEVLFDITKANYLNSQGIITGLNLMGGYVSWGNESACYPSNTDVTDYFYNVSRMFDWVANSVILSVWNKVDRKLNQRLIESVTQSLNLWLNGLIAEEVIYGGRIEFLMEENTEFDLQQGIAHFHIYLAPSSPAKELDFVLEYDVRYLDDLFI